MIFKFRVGYQDYEEVDLSESQAVDLVDFILNGDRGYRPTGSVFLNNASLVANLKSGKLLTSESYEDYRHQVLMQK